MVGFYTGTGFLVSPDFGFSGLDSGFQEEWTWFWVFYRIRFFVGIGSVSVGYWIFKKKKLTDTGF
jgi:hypothetical protein